MTGRRVKDFIQDISGQFNWMSIASGDLTDEEFMLLEQQATQADLSVDDIMHEVAKWNGKPLPKSERYSMRQTPSRRKAANIRNRRSRYEPAQASRNRVKRASNIVRVQEYTLDPIDKQRAEELGVTIEVESYDGDEFEVQLVGEPQDIYELLVDAGAFMWNSFDEFINYGGRGDAHRIGSYRASRSRRSRYQPAPASRFNRRAGILGGDDLEGWLVNIDMNNVDLTEVTDAIAEYVGEDQVRRWAIGEDDGGEYPYEVDEALDLVRDIFMYSSIPGLVGNELRDRFGKSSSRRAGRNRNALRYSTRKRARTEKLSSGYSELPDDFLESVKVMSVSDLLGDFEIACERNDDEAYEMRQAIREELERRSRHMAAYNSSRRANRAPFYGKTAMRNKRASGTSFYEKTSNALYDLPVEAFDESELGWIKNHLRSFGLSFIGADFSDHGDSTVLVEGREDQVIEYLKDYTDEADLEPEDGDFFYWQELAEDIGIRTSNRKNRPTKTRGNKMTNRNYRNRTASMLDRSSYVPRSRRRAAAETERLRRARAARRLSESMRPAGYDRTAARRKTAQELYRTSLDILYPEDIPNIEADYGVIAVQTGVGYHNQEAIFEGTREALLQMLKDNHVGPEFTGDPEEDWLEKVSSNTKEKDTNMNRSRRNRMANRARTANNSTLERNIAQLTLAVRRLAAIQAKIDKDPLEDVSKDIENVEEPVEEPKEIELGTEDLNEQPESAEDAKEEESDDNNPVVESEVVAKRPIRMASRPTASDDFDLF